MRLQPGQAEGQRQARLGIPAGGPFTAGAGLLGQALDLFKESGIVVADVANLLEILQLRPLTIVFPRLTQIIERHQILDPSGALRTVAASTLIADIRNTSP